MPLIQVNGHPLYMEQQGDGDAVILLHGDYECTRYWSAQLQDFAVDHRVIAYDRHGFGRSAPLAALPADFYDRDAADLIGLLDYLNIERAHLVGHSGGGTVALLAAARYPERVRAVVTSGAHVYVEQLTISYVRDFGARLDDPALRRAGEACHGERWRELAEAFVARWTDPAWSDWSILPELSQIHCPALLILGTEDGTVSPAQFADMTQAIPGAHTWLLDGGGHVIHRRHAVAFNQRVRAFLAAVAPPP